MHNLLVIKNSCAFVEDIKAKLIDSMNSEIIDSFINSYSEAFQNQWDKKEIINNTLQLILSILEEFCDPFILTASPTS